MAHGDRPMFYMRLENVNRFGILRLKEKKNARLVQVIQVVPQSKEMLEEQEEIEVFRQSSRRAFIRSGPPSRIPAGEYAVYEYTPGEGDIRAWDFSCQPSTAGSNSAPAPPPDDPGKDP